MKKIILTGDRPTGRLHVGHYVGSLKERVRLQNSGEYDEIYVMIADAQALTDNADNPEKVRQNILQVALDYLACGIDPAKTHIFIQSMVPELTELSFYYMNLVTVSRLQRNPTVKSEIHMRNFETSIPVGFFCYPISQAADITAFHATTVPAGEDQKPMIEQCCEIVRKFNAVYGDTLTEPEIVLPQNAACLRLPGTDGKAKMSKSLGNCIYLSEEPEDIKKKVMSMYTDPNHLRVQDPGKVEGNPVFIYLDAFCRPEHFAEFWPEYQNLDEVKAHYQRGGLGDVKVKKFLNNVMQAELEPIRTRQGVGAAPARGGGDPERGQRLRGKDCRRHAGRGAQVHADRLLRERQPAEIKSMRASETPQSFRTLFSFTFSNREGLPYKSFPFGGAGNAERH